MRAWLHPAMYIAGWGPSRLVVGGRFGRGPFEVNEPLPKPVQLWKASVNKATNKPQELLHFKWQRNAAQRVLESLELHPMSGLSRQSKQENA